MTYHRILTVQDISCVGQCSLTVALPILSAAGLETAILPSAVLSTHTAGFKGYTFRDLTEDMPKIADHWQKEKITFDAIYTGYLGSAAQIDCVLNIAKTCAGKDMTFIVDPAMAENGKLYPGFDLAFVEEMKKLTFSGDIILPNITEACFLTGIEYKEKYDEAYIDALVAALLKNNQKMTVVLTGVSYDDETTGVVVADKNGKKYYRHVKFAVGSHGTGDVYSSAFVGAYMHGKSAYGAAVIAADYTVKCIEYSHTLPNHWYGAAFEPVLPYYIGRLSDDI